MSLKNIKNITPKLKLLQKQEQIKKLILSSQIKEAINALEVHSMERAFLSARYVGLQQNEFNMNKREQNVSYNKIVSSILYCIEIDGDERYNFLKELQAHIPTEL